MKQLHKKLRVCSFVAAIFMLFVGITTVQAQENILGDWTFTMEMPDAGGMGMGGPGGGGMPAITINSKFTKGDDGVITGTWEMNFEGGMGGPGGGMGGPGGGGFQMPAFKIVDVKIDGQKLSFTRKAEGDAAAGGMGGGMMTEDRQFTGTIKGDTIELTSASQMGEMTYKGTRKATAAPAAATTSAGGLTGDWLFTMSMADNGMGTGPLEFNIKSTITKDPNGKYSMTWEQQQSPDMGGMGGFTPQVRNVDIKLDGDKLTFKHIASFGDMGGMGGGGGDMVFNFAGTLKGDTIEGKLISEDNGMGMGATEMAITAKRVSKFPVAATTETPAKPKLEGEWQFITTFGDMGMQFGANATFTKDANGNYACKWEALPMDGMGGPGGGMPEIKVTISDIKLDGEKLTFVQNVNMGDMGGMVSNFTGTLKGDKIEGVFASEMGESQSVATRKKAETTTTSDAGGDPLTGNWELTMSMADNGSGMGMSFEFNIKSTITKDASGKYAMTWEQTMSGGDMGGMGGGMPQPDIKIEDIKLDGDKLTFVQKLNFGDMGGMGGGGEMVSNFTGTVKNNVMEGKMVGQDNGMGMPPMEFTVKGTRK